MNRRMKVVLEALIGMMAVSLFLLAVACEAGPQQSAAASSSASAAKPSNDEYRPAAPEIAEYRAKGLPMVLDFGMGRCIPCKKMAPDLAALHSELAGRVLVRFNDLQKEEALAKEHKIRLMPTQVYLNGQGVEAYRHEGYASKADMTAKMKELGFL